MAERNNKADKLAVLRALALTAAVTKTALPLGTAFDLVIAARGLRKQKAAGWQARLIEAVERWAEDQGPALTPMGGLPSDWPIRLQPALARREEASCGEPMIPRVNNASRDMAVRVLSESVFTPLIASDEAWAHYRVAPGRLPVVEADRTVHPVHVREHAEPQQGRGRWQSCPAT